MAYRKARRPTSEGRIERNKIARMAEERKDRDQKMIHKMMQEATKRVVDVFGPIEALLEFEENRRFAMLSSPPQAGAMVAATMGKCRVMGLIVDKQMTGKPEDFQKTREQIIEDMREQVGDEATQRFLAIYRMFESGKVIDGEAAAKEG